VRHLEQPLLLLDTELLRKTDRCQCPGSSTGRCHCAFRTRRLRPDRDADVRHGVNLPVAHCPVATMPLSSVQWPQTPTRSRAQLKSTARAPGHWHSVAVTARRLRWQPVRGPPGGSGLCHVAGASGIGARDWPLPGPIQELAPDPGPGPRAPVPDSLPIVPDSP
jgi:hypothetical protein